MPELLAIDSSALASSDFAVPADGSCIVYLKDADGPVVANGVCVHIQLFDADEDDYFTVFSLNAQSPARCIDGVTDADLLYRLYREGGNAAVGAGVLGALNVPGAPTNVVAVAGDTDAEVSFDAPADDGGSAITGYTVTSDPGAITATGASSPITVEGLTNDTEYTFTVHATNAIGDSVESDPSDPVTPAAP